MSVSSTQGASSVPISPSILAERCPPYHAELVHESNNLLDFSQHLRLGCGINFNMDV